MKYNTNWKHTLYNQVFSLALLRKERNLLVLYRFKCFLIFYRLG